MDKFHYAPVEHTNKILECTLNKCLVKRCFYSQVKGESHASVCGSQSHTLIPTGARSRPAALPKPIIISVPRPHCWKGSASKPYVELPPHTAPLGMEVGPAQACAVKVVVNERDI